LNQDFVAMLSALREVGAEFLVVGAHALAIHGRPRATGDLDLWVRPTPENAARVWSALANFGAPLDSITVDDLTRPDVVFQIGLAPRRIDILTSISAVEFSEAWGSRVTVPIGDLTVPVLGREALIANKRAVGRLQDLADLEALGE